MTPPPGLVDLAAIVEAKPTAVITLPSAWIRSLLEYVAEMEAELRRLRDENPS